MSRISTSGPWEWQSLPPGVRLRVRAKPSFSVRAKVDNVCTWVFINCHWSMCTITSNCCFLLLGVYGQRRMFTCLHLLQRLARPFSCTVHCKHAEGPGHCWSWCCSTWFQVFCTHVCVSVLSSFSYHSNQLSRTKLQRMQCGRVFALKSAQCKPFTDMPTG